jgi:hypothetical protein
MPDNPLEFRASYRGPIGILNNKTDGIDILAVHQAGEATLDLTSSAQKINIDTSVSPNQISGEASFYTKEGTDLLFSTFTGEAEPLTEGQTRQDVNVKVVFQGGTGRFAKATGTADVQAAFLFDEGISQGTLVGTVLLPNQEVPYGG